MLRDVQTHTLFYNFLSRLELQIKTPSDEINFLLNRI